ncbi:uncharacterized protein GIQ15_04334 [Arthroderma uncinatum]|uniref:uncharacterized protein n=1 Tax=Arthroderma uncinatum TaxID=74035 RepID=UPI00144A98D3|nr:uncharacterized protein GIQ15_04334 [Arthroderma uncinatum]KAF3481575.1 hypothetical protein GIQ15_04334 [Arthroderma uncinatum]
MKQPPKRRNKLPTRRVRPKLHGSMPGMIECVLPSRRPPNRNEVPSEPALDSSVFLDPDDAENTRLGLSQRFNGVAAKKPSAPQDVRKAFLKNEMVGEMRLAMCIERWNNNECICRNPQCMERKERHPRCRKSSSVSTEGDTWIDTGFSAW